MLYTIKFVNLFEMDNFFRDYKSSNLTQEKLDKPIMIEETKKVVNHISEINWQILL